jgi:hypothetical protein
MKVLAAAFAIFSVAAAYGVSVVAFERPAWAGCPTRC